MSKIELVQQTSYEERANRWDATISSISLSGSIYSF
jgi:hypothetical protein